MRRALAYAMPGRRGASNPVSLFPFMAVLVCAMGALIVILAILIREAHRQALAEVVARSAQERVELAQAREDVQLQIGQLRQSHKKTAGQLTEARLELGHLEDHARRLAREFGRLQKTAAELERSKNEPNRRRTELAAEQGRAQAAVAEAERMLAESKRQAAARPRSYAILPYRGPSGTRRRPFYLECMADKIVLRPEGITFYDRDFDDNPRMPSPLGAALRALREQWVRQESGNPAAGEPYLLLLVRPQGAAAYWAARAAIRSWDGEFGYELLGENDALEFPPPDPNLAHVATVATEKARDDLGARRQLVRRAGQTYTAAASGGLVRDDGREDDDDGEGAFGSSSSTRSGGRGGRGGTAGGGGPGGAAGGGAGGGYAVPRGYGPGGGQGGPVLGGPRGADGAGGGGLAGRGDGPPGSGYYPAIGANRGAAKGSPADPTTTGGYPGGGNASGDGWPAIGGHPHPSAESAGSAYPGAAGGSLAGTPSSGIGVAGDGGRQPGAGSQHAVGSNAVGSNAASAAGTTTFGESRTGGRQVGDAKAAPRGRASIWPPSEADGAGEPVGRSTNDDRQVAGEPLRPGEWAPRAPQPPPKPLEEESKEKYKPLAKTRGKNWGLPDAPRMAVALVRPVRVRLWSDRLQIVDDATGQGRDVPLESDTKQSIDKLVSAVWDHMKSWGIAGQGMFWRPVLRFEVLPGGEQRYYELKVLLEGSGLDVTKREQAR